MKYVIAVLNLTLRYLAGKKESGVVFRLVFYNSKKNLPPMLADKNISVLG